MIKKIKLIDIIKKIVSDIESKEEFLEFEDATTDTGTETDIDIQQTNDVGVWEKEINIERGKANTLDDSIPWEDGINRGVANKLK